MTISPASLARAAWHFVRTNALGIAAGLLLGGALVFLLTPRRAPASLPQLTAADTLRVSAPVLNQGKPDTVLGRVERITQPVVKPEHVLVAPGAGAGTVSRFCAKPRVDTLRVATTTDSTRLSAQPDSGRAPGRDSVVLVVTPPPRMALVEAGTLRGETFTLWSIMNDSAAPRAPYRVGPGDFSFRVAGDSIIVQRDRFARLKQWAGRAGLVGVGVGAGFLIGSVR